MFATIAFAAATASSASTASGGGSLFLLLPYLLLIPLFYILMIRPQQLRAKAHAATIEAVKKGDSVITAGGVAGKVTKVDDRFVELEIAPTVKIRVVKSTLAEVTAPGSAKPAND